MGAINYKELEEQFLEYLEGENPALLAIYNHVGFDFETLYDETEAYRDGNGTPLIYRDVAEPFAKEYHDEIVDLMLDIGIDNTRMYLMDKAFLTWTEMMGALQRFKEK